MNIGTALRRLRYEHWKRSRKGNQEEGGSVRSAVLLCLNPNNDPWPHHVRSTVAENSPRTCQCKLLSVRWLAQCHWRLRNGLLRWSQIGTHIQRAPNESMVTNTHSRKAAQNAWSSSVLLRQTGKKDYYLWTWCPLRLPLVDGWIRKTDLRVPYPRIRLGYVSQGLGDGEAL